MQFDHGDQAEATTQSTLGVPDVEGVIDGVQVIVHVALPVTVLVDVELMESLPLDVVDSTREADTVIVTEAGGDAKSVELLVIVGDPLIDTLSGAEAEVERDIAGLPEVLIDLVHDELAADVPDADSLTLPVLDPEVVRAGVCDCDAV